MSVSLSTHVLDTERGEPGIGVVVELGQAVDKRGAAAEQLRELLGAQLPR